MITTPMAMNEIMLLHGSSLVDLIKQFRMVDDSDISQEYTTTDVVGNVSGVLGQCVLTAVNTPEVAGLNVIIGRSWTL